MLIPRIIRCLVFAIAASSSQTLHAAEITPISSEDGVVRVIVIQGELFSGDEQKFSNIALVTQSAVVVLRSEGGSVSAAIEIGKAIRIKGFTTYVPDRSVCASACGFIWLAGKLKALSTTGRVGFHAVYIEQFGVRAVASSGNALVGAYFSTLGLSDTAVMYLTSAPPDGVVWLSAERASQLGIAVKLHDMGAGRTLMQAEDDPRTALPSLTTPVVPWPGTITMPKGRGSASIGGETGPPAGENSFALEREAIQFLKQYLAVENAPVQISLQHFSRNYDHRVFHYGQFKSREDLQSEYARLLARWPLRKYALRLDSIKVNCLTGDNRCEVDAIVDWEVTSASRDAKSAGVSTWNLVLAHRNGSFLITSIDGKVVERHISQLENKSLCFGIFCIPG